ncbi:hypothetical protein GCM10023237_63680 [Streptomyces coeruleoprunus]
MQFGGSPYGRIRPLVGRTAHSYHRDRPTNCLTVRGRRWSMEREIIWSEIEESDLAEIVSSSNVKDVSVVSSSNVKD